MTTQQWIKGMMIGVVLNSSIMAGNSATTELWPFVGKRYFNFYGGNGTEESIEIDKHGVTTMIFYGRTSSAVTYKRPFVNPIKTTDGEVYHIHGNKISLYKNGKLQIGCRDEGISCVLEMVEE